MFPLSMGRTLASGRCPRVQLLVTHPLEATLVGGPLLLHAAGAGAATAVLAVTPGPDAALAAVRAEELRRAARRCWVSRVEVLERPGGFDDGAGEAAIAAFDAEVVVVVGGTTPLHHALLRVAGRAHGRVHVLTRGAAAGARAPSGFVLPTADLAFAWGRLLAEHVSETDVPRVDDAPLVLTRVDVLRVVRQTQRQSSTRLGPVPPLEARSA